MIYVAGAPIDEVDLRQLADRLTAVDELSAGRRVRIEQLHTDLANALRATGHSPDAPLHTDPVVDAFWWLGTEPAVNGPGMGEAPAWLVHPRGSTALGRQLPTVLRWLLAAGATRV